MARIGFEDNDEVVTSIHADDLESGIAEATQIIRRPNIRSCWVRDDDWRVQWRFDRAF